MPVMLARRVQKVGRRVPRQNDTRLVSTRSEVCFINNLPPELLLRIFKFSSTDDDDMHINDMQYYDYWNVHRTFDIDWWDKFVKKDTDAEIEEELVEDEDEDGDEDKDEGSEDTDDKSYSDFDSTRFSSPPPFPILFSHVCRHWRNVTFSNPSLWTTIKVCPKAGQSYKFESMMLERSNNLPIDVWICQRLGHGNPRSLSSTNIRLLFMEYYSMYAFLSVVSDPSVPAAPQFRTLGLRADYTRPDGYTIDRRNEAKHFTLFAGSAPLLTKLVLWGVHIDWNQPWIASASNLTHLLLVSHAEKVRPTWAQFVTILRGASSLKRLSLRSSGPSGHPAEWCIEPTPGGPADLNSPIRLSQLTHLVLDYHAQAHAIGLLHKFCLPALKNLALDLEDGHYTEFVHELARPATLPYAQGEPRSILSSLTSLVIPELPHSTEVIETLYGELLNLASLSLSSWDSWGCAPLYLPVGLPQLQALYVTSVSGAKIRQLVQTRIDAGMPLNSLYVKDLRDMDMEDVEWLRRHVKSLGFWDFVKFGNSTVHDFGS
ncbi:hypothetical protein EV363DRAFT_1350128 [Boletus edulis]|nr:hypothetical protein EV363DRAFT_1350128 [Boletus edulis]